MQIVRRPFARHRPARRRARRPARRRARRARRLRGRAARPGLRRLVRQRSPSSATATRSTSTSRTTAPRARAGSASAASRRWSSRPTPRATAPATATRSRRRTGSSSLIRRGRGPRAARRGGSREHVARPAPAHDRREAPRRLARRRRDACSPRASRCGGRRGRSPRRTATTAAAPRRRSPRAAACSTPPRAAPGPSAASPLKLWVNWDADGNDTANPSGEWVRIRNLDPVNPVAARRLVPARLRACAATRSPAAR